MSDEKPKGFVPLFEATKKLVQKLKTRPIPPDDIFKGREVAANTWSQRRYFIARGKGGISLAWVDDDGTCAGQHLDGIGGDWHQYRDAQGHVFAYRCPDRLPPDTAAKLEQDIPPGHAHNRLREARVNRAEDERRAKVASVKQEYME